MLDTIHKANNSWMTPSRALTRSQTRRRWCVLGIGIIMLVTCMNAFQGLHVAVNNDNESSKGERQQGGLLLDLPGALVPKTTITHPRDDSNAAAAAAAGGSYKVKIALYITTHFSEAHIRYFHCCWPRLVAESPLVRQSHVIVAATNATPVATQELEYLQTELFQSNSKSFQFWTPPNASHLSHCEPYRTPLNRNKKQGVSVSYKQCLANYGVAFGWHQLLEQGYDWMIRLNPDVLIRQSQWLLRNMYHNSSLDAILIHCGPGTRQIHTDFWAIRPTILQRYDKGAFMQMAKIGNHWNHERTAFQHFRPTLAAKRHAWLYSVDPSEGICRVRGPKAPVSHEHDSCTSIKDMTCHGLEGWDLSL